MARKGNKGRKSGTSKKRVSESVKLMVKAKITAPSDVVHNV